MPHDLSHASANSASSSALTYSQDASESASSSSSNHHHYHKNAKKLDAVDMDGEDQSSTSDDETSHQKKVKRAMDNSLGVQQAKRAIVHADMIFYCFEILGNHLFNGRNPSSRYSNNASTSNELFMSTPSVPTCLPSEPFPLFVTWFIGKEKKLRGCIGTFSPMDLAQGLREYALTSALNDSRFSPISRDEYPSLSCAVSILTNFEPCSSFADWIVGRHGIRIEFVNERGSRRSATYLPEVADEQGWNHVQTLDSLLRKGGYRATITADMRASVHVTRYQSEKLTLHYNDYIRAKPTHRNS